MKKILGIGFDFFPADHEHKLIECINFRTHLSTADADIVIASPTISPFAYHVSSDHRGKPCISERSSGQFADDLNYWEKEFDNYINSGKTLFVILNKPFDFFYYTGKRQHSGTGRNRVTTNFVQDFNSQEIIPILPLGHVTEGSQIAYKNSNPVLRGIWEENKEYFCYQITYTEQDFPGEPFFFQKKGKGVIGGIIQTKTGGKIVCLPALELEHPDFTEEVKNEDSGKVEEYWTDKAEEFTKKILTSIVSIDATLKSETTLTPPPSWIHNSTFKIENAEKLQKEIQFFQEKIDQLYLEKDELIKKEKMETQPLRLLYEKGTPLELAIREALSILGFEASPFKDDESEFDVIFSSKEGCFLGEAEGKDNKAVDVSKISQLMRNLSEYLEKEDVDEPPKGVLFGNGYRLKEPNKRNCEFTEKCIKTAKSQSIALIKTSDLFSIVQYLKNKNDQKFKKQCREAILNTVEIIKFPEIPISSKKKK